MVRLPVLLGALVLLCGPAPVLAQQPPSEPLRVWGSLGVGAGLFTSLRGGESDSGPAVVGALVVKKDRHRMALRGSLVAEIIGDDVHDLGVLYGRIWSRARIDGSLSAGVALVRGAECPGITFSGPVGPCTSATTVGLPLSATVSFRPMRFLGMGLEAFADINSLASFAGLGAILELGSLR